MANPSKPRKPKRQSQRDRGYSNIFHHHSKWLKILSQQLAAIDRKVTWLVQHNGGGDNPDLTALAKTIDELDTETGKLKASVQANQ